MFDRFGSAKSCSTSGRFSLRRIFTAVLGGASVILLSSCGGMSSDALTLGGTITGYTGSGLVLSNGSTSLTIPAGSTKFQFPSTISSGTTFEVAVEGDPDGGICAVVGTTGSGTATASNTNSISVECLADGPNGEATAAEEALLTDEPAAPNPDAPYIPETVGAANAASIDTAQAAFTRPAQKVVTNPVTISGQVTFKRVYQTNSQTCAAGTGGCGLGFSNPVTLPARYVQVQVVDATTPTSVISTGYTDGSGNYSLQASSGSSVLVRVYAVAMMNQSTTNLYSVVDNTANNAVYVLQYPSTLTPTGATTANVVAELGYDSSGNVTGTRASAPFTILDDLTNFTDALVAASTNVAPLLKPLTINWSINNVPSPGDKTQGFISTSCFNGTSLDILGKADTDTDEFDVGTMAHEWGHWIQSIMSNSDNPGGNHAWGEIKDFSMAYGEGWGYGFGVGMVTATNKYGSGSAPYIAGYQNIVGYNYDTSGKGSATGSATNLGAVPTTAKGAFDEIAVGYAMYTTITQSGGLGAFINTVIDLRSQVYAATVIGFAASYYRINNTGSPTLVTGMINALSAVNINFSGAPDGFGATYSDSRLTGAANTAVVKAGQTAALQDDYSKLYVNLPLSTPTSVSFTNEFNYGTESSNALGMTRRLKATGLNTTNIYQVCFTGSGVEANQLYFIVRGATNYVYRNALGGIKNCTYFQLSSGDTGTVGIVVGLNNTVITTNYAPVTVTLTVAQ